jgi:hypothetical protein
MEEYEISDPHGLLGTNEAQCITSRQVHSMGNGASMSDAIMNDMAAQMEADSSMQMKRSPHGPDEEENTPIPAMAATPAPAAAPAAAPVPAASSGMAGMAGMKRHDCLTKRHDGEVRISVSPSLQRLIQRSALPQLKLRDTIASTPRLSVVSFQPDLVYNVLILKDDGEC